MQDYSTYIQYNEDNSVKVSFGRAAEWYIANHLLLKNRRLKCQSRQYTPDLVKKGIINVERVEGAMDFVTSFLTFLKYKVTVLSLLDRELYYLKLTRDYVTTLPYYQGWVTTTKIS